MVTDRRHEARNIERHDPDHTTDHPNIRSGGDPPDGRGADRSRWIALYVLCVGMLMIVLDVTVVNVALPAIQDDLGFSNASLAWVVNAYLIAFGGLLLLAGRLGDLIGRRTVFLAGLALFTVASFLCGVANSQWMLVGARFLQGVGGAMTSAVILGMIVTMFPRAAGAGQGDRGVRVRGLGRRLGGPAGRRGADPVHQLALDLLRERADRHRHGGVRVRLLAKDRGIGFRQGADIPGAVLITAALMTGVYTIVKPAAEYGWGAGRTLALGALSLVLLAGFLVREATARQPLIPLRIFRSRNVSGANLVQALMISGMFAMFFLGSLYLERILRYDAVGDRAGLPAGDHRDGSAVGPVLGAADHAVRCPAAARCPASL